MNVCVCGLNGLTAVQWSEDVDARLIVVVACRRGQGLVSVLDERGPVDLMIIMARTNDLAMNGSWHGASQDPGPARGVSNGTVALREPQSFFTVETNGGTAGADVDVRGDVREGRHADGPSAHHRLPKRVIQTKRPPNSSVRAQRRQRR